MKSNKLTRTFSSIVMITFLTSLSGYALAQTHGEVLTNQSVIALVKAGLDKSTVLATVNNAASKYDLSTAAIINLKKQGVSTEIINAMIAKGNKGPVASSGASESTGGTVFDKLDPGIYYSDADKKLIQLEPTVFTSGKTGSGIGAALSYGIAKVKSKAILSGSNANLQIAPGATFYFVFPRNSGGNIGNEGNQNSWVSSATSPNEFILIKFKSINTSRSKSREVVTGSFGTYSGFSSGIPDDNKAPFRFDKIASGVYKVYFETPLAPNEYAFIHAGGSAGSPGSAPAQKAFDFSVK